MKSYQSVKDKLLKNKKTKKSYDELEPEFKLITMIIKKRIKQGLTQTALAKKMNTKQSAISRLERGEYNPTVSFLQKTAKALNSELHISIK